MQIALIVPTDHTCSAQQARGGSVRLSKSKSPPPPNASYCLRRDPVSAITNQSPNDCGIPAVDCFNANDAADSATVASDTDVLPSLQR